MSRKIGALPDYMIADMLGSSIKDSSEKNINPASLDLSVEEIFRVEGIFQPRPNEKIYDILKQIEHSSHDFTQPLERGVTYLAKIKENLSLPGIIYGYCNPKSSTGRNDLHARVMANGISRFDSIRTALPQEYKGDLWLSIIPKSYPVKVPHGETLSQIRLFNQDTRFTETELQIEYNKKQLLYDINRNPLDLESLKISDKDGSLILTLDLSQKIIGYECRGKNNILDLSKRRYYNRHDFFNTLTEDNMKGDFLVLKKDSFYIFSTKEAVVVPPHLACEMVPMDERSGDFRSHYAGFIDPGFGYGNDGKGCGKQITLELRPFEDMIVRDGHPIGKIKFERMIGAPQKHYEQLEKSNYLKQIGPTMSKHFKELNAEPY